MLTPSSRSTILTKLLKQFSPLSTRKFLVKKKKSLNGEEAAEECAVCSEA
jgi:hypothetical protein